MASILADKTESKLTISFAYNRAFIKDIITLSDSTFTLEQTVLPLTGNITYHTHDTTYAAQELETDVWDGTTVSTSWSGSGTEEDPFLIQSCADYIYFLTGEIESLISPSSAPNGDEDPKYIKIVKNLDFNNKEIPLTSPGDNISAFIKYNYILDGNGVVIKNLSIQTASAESGFYLPCHYLPLSLFGFIHDVNFVKVKWRTSEFSLSSLQSAITQMLFANIVFDISLEFTEGEESLNTIALPIVFDYMSLMYPNCSVNIKKQDYIKERGCFFGINIETSRIPSKNLIITVSCLSEYSFFDMSKYNFNGDLGSDQSNIFALQATHGYKEVWLSTLSQGKFIATDISGQLPTTVIDAEVISPEDLKSQSYINEINSSNPVLTLNPNYNLPLIASLQVSYNGYVKKSVFDALGVKVDDINKKILAFLEITGIRNLNESSSSETISEFISWYDNAISNLNISRHKVLHYIVEDSGLIPVSVTGDGPDYNFTWVNRGVHVYKHIFCGVSTSTIIVKENDLIDREEVLVKDNTLAYTPTADYHPATKKYVDNKSNLKNADYTICFENNTRDNPFSPDANADSLVIAGNITSEYSLNYLQPALNNKNNRYYRVKLSDGPITDGNGGDVVGLLEFLQTDSNNGSFLIHMFRGAVVSHMRGYIDISNNSYYAASFG